jgi:hypothetical protein
MTYGRAIKTNYGLDLGNVYAANLGAPALASTNRIVTSVNMKVGAYTIANAASSDSLARNVIATVSKAVENDTMGTLVIVGTDINGTSITETLTLNNGDTSAGLTVGTRAFKTVTSVTGAGWVTGGTADTIVVGFGNKIGVPNSAIRQAPAVAAGAQAFATFLGGALVTATIGYDATDISKCTVDASAGTYNGSKKLVTLFYR